jgi:hypothetical protein
MIWPDFNLPSHGALLEKTGRRTRDGTDRLQVFLGSEKDFEDALHLYQVFEGQLDEDRLQRYVTELEVTEAYDELRRT